MERQASPLNLLSSTLTLLVGVALSSTGSAAPHKPVRVAPVEMPKLPPATIDDSLAVEGPDIAARRASTRMTVEVSVNERGPYRFIVDSGADTSVVGWRISRGQALPAGTPVTLNGITASARVDRVRVDALTLGPSTVRMLELPALDEGDIGGQGMIGIDALAGQRLLLDFETRLIRVEDASRPAQRLDGEIIVVARRRRGQLILTQVRAAGLPVDAVVDTGSEITIGNLALRDKLIRGNRDRFTTVEVIGVTGVTIPMQVATIGELRLGSVTLRNVPMAFADIPPFEVFGLSKEPSLLLGTDLLATFRRISLDFRARKVRFQLRRCGTQTTLVDTTAQATRMQVSGGANLDVCRR